MLTLQQFINRHHIRMTAEWTDRNPNADNDEWARTATHWKCTIIGPNRRKLTVYFSQGPAISGEPTAADVLDCLASDVNGSGQSFEEWCREYGYDTDSRKAERTFKAVEKQTKGLERLLGPELLEQLVYNTERL